MPISWKIFSNLHLRVNLMIIFSIESTTEVSRWMAYQESRWVHSTTGWDHMIEITDTSSKEVEVTLPIELQIVRSTPSLRIFWWMDKRRIAQAWRSSNLMFFIKSKWPMTRDFPSLSISQARKTSSAWI